MCEVCSWVCVGALVLSSLDLSLQVLFDTECFPQVGLKRLKLLCYLDKHSVLSLTRGVHFLFDTTFIQLLQFCFKNNFKRRKSDATCYSNNFFKVLTLLKTSTFLFGVDLLS